MPQDTLPLAAPSDRQGLDLGNWLGRGPARRLQIPRPQPLPRRSTHPPARPVRSCLFPPRRIHADLPGLLPPHRPSHPGRVHRNRRQARPHHPRKCPQDQAPLLALQQDTQRARAELAKAQAANASIISLKSRLNACLAEVSAILGGLLSYSLTKLKRLQRDLDRIPA